MAATSHAGRTAVRPWGIASSHLIAVLAQQVKPNIEQHAATPSSCSEAKVISDVSASAS
jgi:hypothetical protein